MQLNCGEWNEQGLCSSIVALSTNSFHFIFLNQPTLKPFFQSQVHVQTITYICTFDKKNKKWRFLLLPFLSPSTSPSPSLPSHPFQTHYLTLFSSFSSLSLSLLYLFRPSLPLSFYPSLPLSFFPSPPSIRFTHSHD